MNQEGEKKTLKQNNPFPLEAEGKSKSSFPSSQLKLDLGTLTDRRIRRQETSPHMLGNQGPLRQGKLHPD